ncbi:MFS transporter [Brevibacillus humidisoli]|uniref:MFS transporter n=1 Tax=Brevibacillus humidisoli TaxID=2895522 RepID=UPI001E5B2D43|nr:MFS transporter [Brevibacillus humidisoli]
MVFPFMVIYFAEHFGPSIAGFLMLITVIAGLLSSFFGGYYADVKGRKKVLAVSERYRFGSLLLLALVNSPWFELPLLSFFLFLINIVLISISTPANEALIIDASTQETRKYIYTISYWVTNFSLGIGTLIGSFFYNTHFFELLLVISLSSLLSYAIIQKYVTDVIPPSVDAERVSLVKIFHSYSSVFKDRLFIKYFFGGAFLLGIEMQLGNYIGVRLAHQFEMQPLPLIGEIDGVEMFGMVRVENTILVVVLASVFTKIGKALSDRISFYLGSLLFVGGYTVLVVSNDVWILMGATLVFTLGELLYVPVFQAMFADIVPDDGRSKYAAVNKLNIRAAMIMGSLGLTIGAFLPPWCMAVLYVFMGLASVYLYRRLLHHFQSRPKNVDSPVS